MIYIRYNLYVNLYKLYTVYYYIRLEWFDENLLRAPLSKSVFSDNQKNGVLYENELQILSSSPECSYSSCKVDTRQNRLDVQFFKQKRGEIDQRYKCYYNPANHTQVPSFPLPPSRDKFRKHFPKKIYKSLIELKVWRFGRSVGAGRDFCLDLHLGLVKKRFKLLLVLRDVYLFLQSQTSFLLFVS